MTSSWVVDSDEKIDSHQFARLNQILSYGRIEFILLDSVQSVVSYGLSANIDSKQSLHIQLVSCSVFISTFFVVLTSSASYKLQKHTHKKVAPIAKLRLHIYNRYELSHSSITWVQQIKSNRF